MPKRRNKYVKIRLWNCFKAAILGTIFASISILEDSGKIHYEYPVVGFISGFLTGVFELFIYRERLRNMNFFLGLLIKSSSYTAAIYLIIVTVLSLAGIVTEFESIKLELELFVSKEIILLILQSFKVSILIVFLLQLDVLLGDGAFRRYVSGKYHQPKSQKMVFMFLDMKGSTSKTEKLGDKKYYELVDDFFHDISRPIIENEAEIYKYVGDEVIIMWPLDKAIENNNCINFFTYIKKKIKKRSSYYLQKYGTLPEFKAGVHSGDVVSALIGDIRKEIVYSGDVLNTASRLEKLCNMLEVDILISESLIHELDLPSEIEIISQGEMKITGKSQEMEIFTIKDHSL